MAPRSPSRGAGRLWQPAASLLILLALWQAGALLADNRLFPGPLRVAAVFWTELAQGPLAHHLGITLLRVAASFVVAIMAGGGIGFAAGRWPGANRWLQPWLILLLNVPALVVIILIYIWLGLTEAALILAVALNKIPNIAVTVREGAARLDRDLAEVAEIYRFGAWTRFRSLILPQLAPYLLVSARNGLALTWKIVLVAELLGRSSGIGFQLQVHFQNFEVDRILAYALAFSLVVLAIEYGLLGPMERRLAAWRR